MPYFDHNATTPLSPAARAAWLKMADEAWHNPSSLYRAAARARIRLDSAREALAALLGGEPAHTIFTSGATEGAHAVLGHLAATLPAGSRLAINPTEHPCVIAAAQRFFGDRVLPLPVTADGVVTTAAVEAALADPVEKTGAVVVMAANNETGVIQPWREIARACRAATSGDGGGGGGGVPFVCDVTQWLGKLPGGGFGEAETGATLIATAHKFGGPKGTGFIKLPADDPGFRLQPGGSQEHDHRGGTEDLPSIAALVAALADAEQQKVFLESDRLRLRDTAERALLAAVPGARIIAAGADRLWNTILLLLPFGENTRWVTRLDKRDVQVSTGSACATGKTGPSHVLTALGLTPDEARRSLRISSGWETTEADWQTLAAALAEVAAELWQP